MSQKMQGARADDHVGNPILTANSIQSPLMLITTARQPALFPALLARSLSRLCTCSELPSCRVSGLRPSAQACKHHLYLAKQLLWRQLGPADQDQLDEQMALSIALQESVQYQLPEIAPRVYHYSREKRDKQGDWYQRVHGSPAAVAGEPQAVVSSPRTLG